MTKYLFLLLMICTTLGYTQTSKIDSLKNELISSTGEEKIGVLLQLSGKYRTKSLDTAQFYAEQALQLAEKLGDQRSMAKSYLELGNITCLKGENKESIEYSDMGIEIMNEEHDALYIDLVNNKGTALTYSGQLEEGLQCFQKVLAYWILVNDSIEIADILNNMGVINYYMGDYSAAMRYLLESVEIYDLKGKKEEAASTYGNMGAIYIEMDNYEKAIEYTFRALNVYEQLEDYHEQTGLLINLGNIYKNMDSLEKSIQCCTKALKIATENGYTPLVSMASSNLGLAYEKQGLYHKAIDAVKKSLAIAQQQEDIESEAKNLRFLGSLYKKVKDYKRALQYLDRSEELAHQMNLVSDYYDIYLEKSDVYQSMNNYEKSLEYYKKYTAIKDSIFNEEKHKQITEIETKYETAKKEKELIQLSAENSQQKMVILKSRYYTFGMAGLIIIVLLLGFMFFRQNRIRSRQKTLELEQKLFRSQMNPHFIFNSLSSIQYFITTNKPIEAGAYLADFAKLMRLVIENSSEEYITLEQEVDTMKYYLQMQKLRFDDNFTYQFDVDEQLETQEVLIPPMLTQPFIENALEHAFTGQENSNTLLISYVQQNGNLSVKVDDNGIGRKEAANLKKSKHKSFAINVTQSRLEKLNRKSKRKINFEIIDKHTESGEPLGTTVNFSLPMIYND